MSTPDPLDPTHPVDSSLEGTPIHDTTRHAVDTDRSWHAIVARLGLDPQRVPDAGLLQYDAQADEYRVEVYTGRDRTQRVILRRAASPR